MELRTPKLTIQNTDQSFWLVRMEHTFSDCEHIDMQLKVQRAAAKDAVELQHQLLREAVALLQAMLANKPDSGRAGAA